MKALFALFLFLPALCYAGGWVPYTDGRAGGCATDNRGNLVSCTPQLDVLNPPPAASPGTSRRDLEAAYQQGQDDARARKAVADLFQRPAPRPQYQEPAPPAPVIQTAVPEAAYTTRAPVRTAGDLAAENGRANAKTYDLTRTATIPLSECAAHHKTPTCDNNGCACK